MEFINILLGILKYIISILCFYMLFHEYREHKKRSSLINKHTIDNPELASFFLSLEETSHTGLWLALILFIQVLLFCL